MTYPIVLYGEPVLEKNAETVTDFDTPEMHQLIDDMVERPLDLAGPLRADMGVVLQAAVDHVAQGRGRFRVEFLHRAEHLLIRFGIE